MIARVTLSVPINGEMRSVRAYLGVDKDASRQYLPAAEVLNDRQMRGQILTEMKNDLEAMRRRYESYEFCAKAIAILKRAVAVLEEAPSEKRRRVA